MHLFRVSGDWHFWVDTGPVGRRADISPFVGIRCDILESTVGELLSLPADDTVGSLGANVGYILSGQYREWDEAASSTEVLAAIDAAHAKLRPLMTFDRLADGWTIDGARDPLWRYREITLLLLRHDTERIALKLEAARKEFCRYEDSMALQFQEFEQRVLTRSKA